MNQNQKPSWDNIVAEMLVTIKGTEDACQKAIDRGMTQEIPSMMIGAMERLFQLSRKLEKGG